jgi:hypothetical protein
MSTRDGLSATAIRLATWCANRTNPCAKVVFQNVIDVINSKGRIAYTVINECVQNSLFDVVDDGWIPTKKILEFIEVQDLKKKQIASIIGTNFYVSAPPPPLPTFRAVAPQAPCRERTVSKNVAQHQETVKAKLANRSSLSNPISTTVKIDDATMHSRAYGMATAYEEALGQYQSNPTLHFIKHDMMQPGHKMHEVWVRAVQLADQLGVSYTEYVRAQFWAFDQWFSRAPKPYELASYKTKVPAQERVRLYMEALAKGELEADKKIINKVRSAPKVTRSVKFSFSERQMQQFMKNYGASEEQILKTFAKGKQANLYFDREWLLQNPTYQRLKTTGEV